MRKTMRIAVLSTALMIGCASTVGAENLGDILREFGWHRMIGTWVDAETEGENYKSVTTWKFKDHVIETASKNHEEGKNEISLMIYSPERAEIFHVSADDKGGSSIGKWTFTKDEAILDLGYVTPEKLEGLLQVRYRFIDDDTITATAVLPDPVIITMIRVRERTQDEQALTKVEGICPNGCEIPPLHFSAAGRGLSGTSGQFRDTCDIRRD